MAQPLIDDTIPLPDGARLRLWAVRVPESDRYPEGVKYSFQYLAPDDEPVIRYDNFPDHPDVGRHHKHTPAGVETIPFDGLEAHVQAFKADVTDYRE